jgi:hypothetical protein
MATKKNVYGFAVAAAELADRKSGGGGGGGTQGYVQAKREYDIFVEKNNNSRGELNNPKVLQQARKFLKPYLDNSTVLKKYEQSITDQTQLMTDLDDVKRTASEMRKHMGNQMAALKQTRFDDTDSLILDMDATYRQFMDFAETEIEAQRGMGRNASALQTFYDELDEKVVNLNDITDGIIGADTITSIQGDEDEDTSSYKDGYAWFISTAPGSGKITNMELKQADSGTDNVSQFVRTDTRYSDIPVWTETRVDPYGGETIAKIGGYRYNFDPGDSKTEKILKFDQERKGLFGWGGKVGVTLDENMNISLDNVEFADPAELPKGTYVKDSNGVYWQNKENGVNKLGNKQQAETITGEKIDDDSVMNLTFDQSDIFNDKSFEDESIDFTDTGLYQDLGNYRKKDDSSSKPVSSALPSLDKKLSTTLGTGSGGNLASPQEVASLGPKPFQVPRKDPKLDSSRREVNSSGQYSSGDIIADEQESIINQGGSIA